MTWIRRDGDPSRARRAAEDLARQLGFPPSRIAQISLVAMEMGTNLLRHAQDGHLIVQDNDGAVELVSIDAGPGIDDYSLLQDGRSSQGTMGAGFGTMQRFSNHFELDTGPSGTAIVCRLYADRQQRPAPPMGGVVIGLERASGDAWAHRITPEGLQIVAIDGAGHGRPAAEAAHEAIRAFRDGPTQPVQLLEHMHKRLGSTRGAAVTVATINGSLRYAGIGNVDGRWMADRRRGIGARPGTVGNNLGAFRPAEEVIEGPGDMVLASDGLVSTWSEAVEPGIFKRDVVLAAAMLMRDYRRGTDDAMVVVCRGAV